MEVEGNYLWDARGIPTKNNLLHITVFYAALKKVEEAVFTLKGFTISS